MKIDHRTVRGFTLVEMAMVMLIIGLLLGGLMPTLSAQMEAQRVSETRKQLEDIQQALIGFAAANGRLPCPANATSNGEESPLGGGNCSNFNDGYVPAATLGLTAVDSQGRALDAWNNPIRYAVTNWSKTTAPAVPYVYTSSNGISLAGISALSPDLKICSTAIGISATDCASGTSLTSNGGVPAVVYSLGRNGQPASPSPDEAANLDNNNTFVSHPPTSAGTASGEFDDLVVWLSNNILLNRMIAAGKLP